MMRRRNAIPKVGRRPSRTFGSCHSQNKRVPTSILLPPGSLFVSRLILIHGRTSSGGLAMNTLSISRRKFAHLLGFGAAAAIVRPRFTIAAEQPPKSAPTGSVVRLSANENPYGPSLQAHAAMKNSFDVCNRYPDEANDVLIEKIAKINGVNREQVVLGDGSSEILKLCAETFTGPTQGKLIAPDPTFEAILEYSKACGGE